ncbi:hypothetical protein ASD11_00695 [Aeromicrobium sp. Root495]|uniref:hypothetical protein n=1 Tax=Aeromicrobium sp. Root495 TaxID=1736550 RepID=UPI0006F5CA38|nr:hypothetical protein [Aeromicrobium sp. Root495]KQY58223.1 hypothetical protein ASD11_00695 [Aeromicrobium sp. Root495]
MTSPGSYDPVAVLGSIDDHRNWVLACFAVAAVFTFSYFIESFRLVARHHVYTAPLAAVGWFAMHDLGFVLQYDDWFNTYDHWWVKAWWFALIATSVIELVFVAIFIRYGWSELLPQVSHRTFALLSIAMMLGIGAVWAVTKSVLGDELYLVSFPVTAFWALPFSTALALRRGSGLGQSPRQEVFVVFIVVAFQAALWPLDEVFRSVPFMAFTVTAVCWGVANVWLLRVLPDGESPRDTEGVSRAPAKV